jgi:stage III sporulation protein AB
MLQNCIRLLETEIIYSATPLPEALESVYKKGNKKVSFIFKEIKEYLLSNKNASVLDSFIYITNLLKEKLFFTDEDIEIIMTLGRVLGASNRIDQQKHFQLINTQLVNQQREAEDKKLKNEKMYRSLGIMTGLAITIILL